jgi:hypothetical protein
MVEWTAALREMEGSLSICSISPYKSVVATHPSRLATAIGTTGPHQSNGWQLINDLLATVEASGGTMGKHVFRNVSQTEANGRKRAVLFQYVRGGS